MNVKNLEGLVPLQKGEKILHQKVSRLTEPGDNYGSIMLSVVITVQTTNGTKDIHAVAKTVPPNEFIQKIFDTPLTFRNEIAFYKDIIPLLQDFQRSHGVEKTIDFTPKFLGGRLNLDGSDKVDDDGVLLLENLTIDNYKILERTRGLDFDSARLVLTDLAHLHGVSLALRLQKPEVFKQHVLPFLRPRSSVKREHEAIKERILSVVDNSEISTMKPRIIAAFDNQSTQHDPEELFATVVHDDCWTNNTMLKFQDGSPIKSKLVDFQCFTYGSPARDLILFLFSSVESIVIEEFYNQLIRLYLETLISVLKTMHCDTSRFTLEALEKEMETEAKQSEFFHVIFMLFPIFADRKNAVELSELRPGNILTSEPSDLHRKKLAFVVNEFAKRNWI